MSEPKEQTAVSFKWIDPAKVLPAVKKIAAHELYKISSSLLLHDAKKGVTPGYFLQYLTDCFHAGAARKKGDGIFHSMKDEVLNDVVKYYPVDKIPVDK